MAEHLLDGLSELPQIMKSGLAEISEIDKVLYNSYICIYLINQVISSCVVLL
jgi:cell division protein FtsL